LAFCHTSLINKQHDIDKLKAGSFFIFEQYVTNEV